MFMECSWGVQPVLGVFAFLETTILLTVLQPQTSLKGRAEIIRVVLSSCKNIV